MADHTNPNLCTNTAMASLLATIRASEEEGLRNLDSLLEGHPKDPRLHFLRGSLLAARQSYLEAREAMQCAVDLAPAYAIARFQLGFLLLTSGEADRALAVWQPLKSDGSYLRDFVDGLTHMIHDAFEDAVRILRVGIECNRDNPALNRDIQLLIDEMTAKGGEEDRPAASAVDLVLRQSAMKLTKH